MGPSGWQRKETIQRHIKNLADLVRMITQAHLKHTGKKICDKSIVTVVFLTQKRLLRAPFFIKKVLLTQANAH